MEDDGLAKQVYDYTRDNRSATVAEIAEAVEEEEQNVISILDEYKVNNSRLFYVGPGGGGGWIDSF